MELPEARLALMSVPPWLVLAALIGVMNGAASFMLIGRHLSRLAWYVVLGIFAAGLGQVVGEAVGLPAPVKIGDVSVLATSLGTWMVILAARLGGL